jgi:hypothetical protein
MNGNWKKLTVKVSLWLVAEIALNVSGLDNIADYTEFVFSRHGSSLTAARGTNPSLLS